MPCAQTASAPLNARTKTATNLSHMYGMAVHMRAGRSVKRRMDRRVLFNWSMACFAPSTTYGGGYGRHPTQYIEVRHSFMKFATGLAPKLKPHGIVPSWCGYAPSVAPSPPPWPLYSHQQTPCSRILVRWNGATYCHEHMQQGTCAAAYTRLPPSASNMSPDR
jgi:hypothetical protein